MVEFPILFQYSAVDDLLKLTESLPSSSQNLLSLALANRFCELFDFLFGLDHPLVKRIIKVIFEGFLGQKNKKVGKKDMNDWMRKKFQ